MISFHETLLRLLFAAAMGALIGLERDPRRRPGGIRASMLVYRVTELMPCDGHT